MTHDESPVSDRNPFCAARLTPGTIPFVFEHGDNLDSVVQRLRQSQWRGQITGPHGTGKSTLLVAVLKAIEPLGMHAVTVALHDGERRLPGDFRAAIRDAGQGVVAVDGYEQLRAWRRLLLKRFCRRRGLGLIVTAHRSVGLPDLYRTNIDVPTAWHVVQNLQEGYPARIALSDVVEVLTRRCGNLREAMFDLYDRYEQAAKGKKGLAKEAW